MSKHTKEPWFLDTSLHIYGESDPKPIEGFPGGKTVDQPHVATAKHYADAARIVACVNACAGLSIDELSYLGNGGAAKAIHSAQQDAPRMYAGMKEQRDVLLAALKRLSAAALSRDVTMGDPISLINAKAELAEANKQAIEAIAKAEGAQS